MKDYEQIVVWPATIVGEENVKDFEKFIKDELGCRAKYITEVKTNPDQNEDGSPVKDTGGRNDVLFYIHKDDVGKFAVPRFQFGMRWWEDVIKYNDGAYLYSEEILEKYPATW